jgi:hypothetical protein
MFELDLGVLRQCLAVLSDSPISSYDSNILLSALLAHCTKINLELARVKSLAGHPNNAEVDRFLGLLARHDEAYIREAEDFEVKAGALASDVARLLDAAGRPAEAQKFTLLADELAKRFTIKSYLVDSLFSEILAILNRSIPQLRASENADFFFSGWATAKFQDISDFQSFLLELRPRELRVLDRDGKSIKKFTLLNASLSVSLAPEREISLEPLLRVREVAGGPSLEVWTKAFARALN